MVRTNTNRMYRTSPKVIAYIRVKRIVRNFETKEDGNGRKEKLIITGMNNQMAASVFRKISQNAWMVYGNRSGRKMEKSAEAMLTRQTKLSQIEMGFGIPVLGMTAIVRMENTNTAYVSRGVGYFPSSSGV